MANRYQINVMMSDAGVEVVDSERGQISRSEYIRQAVQWAVRNGFKPEKKALL